MSYFVILTMWSYAMCMHHENPLTQDYHFNWYQYHFAAIGTWSTWMEMMILLGKTPQVGVHLEMIKKVTRSVSILLCSYGFIFIAFTTSFYILFPSHAEYQSNLIIAMTKVNTLVLIQTRAIHCFSNAPYNFYINLPISR